MVAQKHMQEITIQKKSTKDVEAVNNVYYKTWLDTYPNIEARISEEDIKHAFIDDFSEMFIAKEKERIRNLPENKRPLVAKVGEKVVGICVVKNNKDTNSLETIYVLPDYQGKGVGKMLWEEAKKSLDINKDIVLEVVSYSKSTIKFYEKLGFVKIGEVYQDKRLVFKSGAMFPTIKMVLRVKE